MIESGVTMVSKDLVCGCRNSGDCIGVRACMSFRLRCPFCKIYVTTKNDERGIKCGKEWMGKHLARYHQGSMNQFGREQKMILTIEEDIASAFGVYE